VYATEPCPWSAIEVAAVGACAGVVAELLRASMALGARDAEAAELTQALTARVWVEQAKAALVATEGLDPGAASQRLRGRAGRRSVRWPTWPARWCGTPSGTGPRWPAAERAGSRAAEARAEHAEAALEAAQAEASRRTVGRTGRLPAPTTGSAEPRQRWL
jgi:ANTAR domain